MTAEEVVRRLNGKWMGDQALAHCPVEGHGKGRGDLSPSLSIAAGKGGRVLLHCFAGCRVEDIFAALRSDLRPDDSGPRTDIGASTPWRSTTAAAQSLWNAARSVKGTPAEVYLQSRRLPADSDALRFAAQARHPGAIGSGMAALLAAIRGPDNVLLAVQRTFLTREGAKTGVDPARMMLGRLGHGAVRLAPAAPVLGLAEGVETALAATQLHGVPCWAACGARLDRIALPQQVRRVILFADSDLPGRSTAERAARRARAEGRCAEIHIPEKEGTDWADVLAASAHG